jgi:hypothetical protein
MQVSDSRWETIQQESITILEQIMRKNIRDYQVAEKQSAIPI